MYLRNKKTGEVIEWSKNLTYKLDREYTSLKELCENYEDCEAPEPEKWEPKEGDEYWKIGSDGIFSYNVWRNHYYEHGSLAMGNIFRTKKDADKALAWLKARKVLYDDAKGFKPNWKDEEEKKWAVYCDTRYGGLHTDWFQQIVSRPGPHFATREDAEASIKAHEKEWKIYLGVEE